MENIYGSVTNISVMEPNEIGRAGMPVTIDQMENIYGSVMEPNETGRAEMSVTVDQARFCLYCFFFRSWISS
nr:transcription factor GTE6-like isoform X1 [Ipomoea batatas]